MAYQVQHAQMARHSVRRTSEANYGQDWSNSRSTAYPGNQYGGGQGNYDLQVIVQPPSRARVGVVLQPTVTVQVRLLAYEDPETTEPGDYFAMVSLVAVEEPGSTRTPATPRNLTGVLTGNEPVSIKPFIGDGPGQSGSLGIGYASFPRLTVGAEGSYRLKIQLLKVCVLPTGQQGGFLAGEVDSKLFKVRARS